MLDDAIMLAKPLWKKHPLLLLLFARTWKRPHGPLYSSHQGRESSPLLLLCPALEGDLSILLIIPLIRSVAEDTVDAIKRISRVAESVARGNYGDPLPQKTQDKIGQLIGSFNAMVRGLKERDFISNTFGRYVDQEVARVMCKIPLVSLSVLLV
jgi:HAMP domain-containing protein